MFQFATRMFLVLMVFSVTAFAQGSTGRRIADPNYVVTRTVSETIVSTNLKSNELMLKDWDGRNHTVKINKDTKLMNGGRNLDLRELREGQTIRLTYRVADGTALEIRLLTQPPRK